MGDHQGTVNLGPFVGVDLNLWSNVYIAVIEPTDTDVKWIKPNQAHGNNVSQWHQWRCAHGNNVRITRVSAVNSPTCNWRLLTTVSLDKVSRIKNCKTVDNFQETALHKSFHYQYITFNTWNSSYIMLPFANSAGKSRLRWRHIVRWTRSQLCNNNSKHSCFQRLQPATSCSISRLHYM